MYSQLQSARLLEFLEVAVGIIHGRIRTKISAAAPVMGMYTAPFAWSLISYSA